MITSCSIRRVVLKYKDIDYLLLQTHETMNSRSLPLDINWPRSLAHLWTRAYGTHLARSPHRVVTAWPWHSCQQRRMWWRCRARSYMRSAAGAALALLRPTERWSILLQPLNKSILHKCISLSWLCIYCFFLEGLTSSKKILNRVGRFFTKTWVVISFATPCYCTGIIYWKSGTFS